MSGQLQRPVDADVQRDRERADAGEEGDFRAARAEDRRDQISSV